VSWPFSARRGRASQQHGSTLHVVAGDGADGTGGPNAARHGGPIILTSDRAADAGRGDRWVTLARLLGLDPVEYPDAHEDLAGAQVVDLDDHGLVNDLARYFAGVDDPAHDDDQAEGPAESPPQTGRDRSGTSRAAEVWDAWPVDARAFAEATAAAERFTSEEVALATAPPWSSRVDAAVHGMDAADPDGMDAWMQAHADSPAPHLYEARLVAAWETRHDTDTTHTDTDDADDADDSDTGADGADTATLPAIEAEAAGEVADTDVAVDVDSTSDAASGDGHDLAADDGSAADDGWP
jgi:hypothetical protein